MMRNNWIWLLALVLLTSMSSCSYYNARYLQYFDENEKYEQNQIGEKEFLKNEYIIREGDELQVAIYTLTDRELNFIQQGVGMGNSQTQGSIPYRVRMDGTIILPKVGPVLVRGFTIEEAEEMLALELQGYLEDPVARIDVASFSVTVIGEEGSGVRVPMINGSISILEAVAISGVVKPTSKTRKAKIVRRIGFKNYLYEVDLTDVNLVYSPNYYLHPNDIVYVQPTFMGNFRLSNLQQFIGFISAAIVIYTFVAP